MVIAFFMCTYLWVYATVEKIKNDFCLLTLNKCYKIDRHILLKNVNALTAHVASFPEYTVGQKRT